MTKDLLFTCCERTKPEPTSSQDASLELDMGAWNDIDRINRTQGTGYCAGVHRWVVTSLETRPSARQSNTIHTPVLILNHYRVVLPWRQCSQLSLVLLVVGREESTYIRTDYLPVLNIGHGNTSTDG